MIEQQKLAEAPLYSYKTRNVKKNPPKNCLIRILSGQQMADQILNSKQEYRLSAILNAVSYTFETCA